MKYWIYWAFILSVGAWVGACSPTFNPTDPIPVTVSPTPTGTLSPSGFSLAQFQSYNSFGEGQTITYTLFYSEPSSAVAPNLAIWDTVPNGVQFLGLLPGPTAPPAMSQSGNVLIWTYPGPVTGLSGAITWQGTVHCSSGPITNTASLQTQSSSVTDSNQVTAVVACNTATFTATPTSGTSTDTPTRTATPTGTLTGTQSPTDTPTWTFTDTPTQPVTYYSSVTPTFTWTPVVNCSGPATWGDWNPGSSSVTLPYGTSCQRYVLTQPMEVDSINFIADTHGATGYMSVGLYYDGGGYPSTVAWGGGSFPPFTANDSLVTVTIDNPVYLAAGTYWLAIVGDGVTTLRKASGSTSVRYWRSGEMMPMPFMSPGGPLPTPINTPPPSTTTDIVDLWALGCQ